MTIALPVCRLSPERHSILCQCKNKNPCCRKRGTGAAKRFFRSMGYLTVGGQKIESRFLGEAHTKDNIVTWIPSEHILFGGCQVKSLGSAKGNLADANVDAWSETTRRIKAAYKDAGSLYRGMGMPAQQNSRTTPSGFLAPESRNNKCCLF